MKGLVLLVTVIAAFLFTSWPRDVVALTAAGVLLLSRRMASREMVGLVDWHLLVLFVGLSSSTKPSSARICCMASTHGWRRPASICSSRSGCLR
jgi:hypothetical protein